MVWPNKYFRLIPSEAWGNASFSAVGTMYDDSACQVNSPLVALEK